MFSLPLSDTTVAVVDCQATGSDPGRSHLLEVGWALVRASDAGPTRVTERLVRLPPGARLPPEVTRLTGLDARALEAGVAPELAWRELAAAAASLAPVTLLGEVPAVVHFARYEERFLRPLARAEARAHEPAGAPGQVSLAFVCTHAIARRLLPDLPRMTLRALTGYLGRAVGPMRRSGEHVTATAFVWRELVRALAAEAGVRHFDELAAWLRAPAPRSVAARAPREQRRRVYPLARELRLGLPDLPGVYRLLRAGGDVLYVGKATSLKERVNDHFRGRGTGERALEMLSQARDLAVTLAASPLEAALLESDLIKAHDPPYNVALRPGPRPWFASPRALAPERAAGKERTLGPFAGAEPLARLAALRDALARAEVSPDTAHAVLGMPESRAPEAACFAEGLRRFAARHELGARLHGWRALGAKLWRAELAARAAAGALAPEPAELGAATAEDPASKPGALERTAERRLTDPDAVAAALEALVSRAAHAVRRGAWLCRIAEASLGWTSASAPGRLLVVRGGAVVTADAHAADAPLPAPPGARRSGAARRAAFDLASFDRMSVLTAELKRLVASGARARLRLGAGPELDTPALTRWLRWV